MTWCFRAPWCERIVSGPGCTRAHLGNLIAELAAERVLVITGTTLASRADVLDHVLAPLAGREVSVFSATLQHSPRATVLAAADALRAARAQCVISFGGGTPIDTAKLAAMCVAGDVRSPEQLDALHLRFPAGGEPIYPRVPEVTLPHIAIPTTLSGGEHTDLAGSVDPVTRHKHVYACPGSAPRFILLDPELAAATPDRLWASTGMRALDHAIEGYCSVRPQPINDALAVAAARRLFAHLAGRDRDAREACLIAASQSIMCASRNVPMGLSHSLARQLGGRYGVPHGLAAALTLPAVLAFNAAANGARQRELARELGSDAPLADTVRELARSLGVHTRLRDWDVPRDDLPGLAEDAMADWGVVTNPRRVAHASEIVALLETMY